MAYCSYNGIIVHDRLTGVVELAANYGSWFPITISGDGRYVAFTSYATNLVPEDTNGVRDIFVYDRQTGVTERVSVDSSGNQANDHSWWPAISYDGRYVVFESNASNLAFGDINHGTDIFVHDRVTGITEHVSVGMSPTISSDGRYVGFDYFYIYLYDRQTGIKENVSIDTAGNIANDYSLHPSLSGDGRYVAFMSCATNLVPEDTNNVWDIFVHDRDMDVPKTVEETIAVVYELLAVGDITSSGIATGLTSILENTLNASQRGNVYAAKNMLIAFMNAVEAQAGKKISEKAATFLIDAVRQIINSL